MGADPYFFEGLNYRLIQALLDSPEVKMDKWKGYLVLTSDGTKMELPHNKTTYKEFNFPWKGNKNKKSSKINVSCVVDVFNDYVYAIEVVDADTSEEELLYNNIFNIIENMGLDKFILIMDRTYPSIRLLQNLAEDNINYLFRLAPSYYKEERNQMKTDDEEVKIELTENRLNEFNPRTIEYIKSRPEPNVRLTVNKIKENELITITNLSKEILSKEEIKDLYYKRWAIEIAYNRLKSKDHLEIFLGRKKNTILIDLFSAISTYNEILAFKKDLEEEKQIEINLDEIELNPLISICKNIFYEFVVAKDMEERNQLQESRLALIEEKLLSTHKE